ncbi:MAG: TonB-dependent receptor [Halioglobus sp.]
MRRSIGIHHYIIFYLLACATASTGSWAAELENIVVTGRKPAGSTGSQLHGFSSYTQIEDLPNVPPTLSSLVSQLPGVALAGQGGLLQTVAIRGLSRQRVGSYFLDIPILTERRAGTAASFIDPAILDGVELVRGPATTAYGSGNLGGLIRSIPGTATGLEARLGWGGSGSENNQLVRYGEQNFYAALSHRGSNDAETPDGTDLHTEYDQWNLLLGGETDTESATYKVVTLLTDANDIGKSNVRYPDDRVTTYPDERHWLSQISRLTEDDQIHAFVHYQDLSTEVLRPGVRLDVVDSSSIDFGARYVREWETGTDWRWGLDYLGRRNVDIDEQRKPIDGLPEPSMASLRAEQDEIAVFVEAKRSWSEFTATAGARLGAQQQNAEGWSEENESLVSAYLGANWSFATDWSANAELSRGVRVANLSEKFFSGTTGRGLVQGNPNLSPEVADNIDLGVVYDNGRLQIETHVFYMALDDFIERVPISTEVLSFRNLDGGHISGMDFDARLGLDDKLEIGLGGQIQSGENEEGNNLQDISPNRLSLNALYRGATWQWSLDYQHRFEHDDVAATEQSIGSADLLSFSITKPLSESMVLSVWGRNLLDQTYILTTDELSTAGEKIAFGVEWSWRSMR